MDFLVSTHEHSDHIMAAEKLKKRLPDCKTVISAASGASADILVRHGDRIQVLFYFKFIYLVLHLFGFIFIQFGRHNIEVRATPGHTHGIKSEKLLIQQDFCVTLFNNISRLRDLCMSRRRSCIYWRYFTH